MPQDRQKTADQAYKNVAARKERDPSLQPWEELDAGSITWDEFSAPEQENIVRHYAPKVKYLASRMKARLPRNVDVNELISAGSMGLVESFSKFKPQLGVKFDTYAENRIRGAMLDELRRMDWFPRSLRQKVRQLDTAIMQLEQNTGESPSEEDLVRETGLSTKEVREGMEAMQSQLCFPLDVLENAMADSEGGLGREPFELTAENELLNRVADLIEQLTPREKLVLSLYYSDELNMREAAEVMGITEGRVSQLHTQAVGRLRRELHSRHGLPLYN